MGDNAKKARISYSREDNVLLEQILTNEARQFILSKGVMRAVEKNHLYMRLTDAYNER